MPPGVAQWEVHWGDLRVERLLGRGAYGRVSAGCLCEGLDGFVIRAFCMTSGNVGRWVQAQVTPERSHPVPGLPAPAGVPRLLAHAACRHQGPHQPRWAARALLL